MTENRGSSKRIVAFLGGAALTGIVGLLGVLLGVVQIGQTEIHHIVDSQVEATLVAVQEQQLEALEGIATIQASGSDNQSSATSATRQIADLEATVEALQATKVAVEATATASAKESRTYRILIDEYHGYDPIGDEHRKRLLRDDGFYFETATEAYDAEKLYQCDILIFDLAWHFGEKVDFTDDELEMIKKYTRQGGSVFLVGKAWVWTEPAYGNRPIEEYPQNIIAKDYGIWFEDKYVWNVADDTTPILHAPFMDLDHPIVQGVSEVGPDESGSVPGSLRVNEPALPVIWGDYDTEAFGEKNPVVLAAANAGESRIVALHDSAYISNSDKYDNNLLLENILMWLVEK
jgi:hypothetical protein